ncbi:MAG TPA: cytochrome d ubiquinol oxidase subunit II [Candidatus Limnocylindrales bacterium]|nr:cytochrome d ubiquinol oxidase subunit II [Candidatus Limnocylindrales bacterium]
MSILPLEGILAGVMMISLTLYALMGGADYGGGVWDLLAWGPRAKAQRELIAEAIGPIWEANHVWLILVIVVLFTGFPLAFAVIATALHIPLTLMLLGIVLRGSAFAFRTYGTKEDRIQRRWGRVFSIASLVTPLLLGTVLGAIASGQIRLKDRWVVADFVRPWLAPFPLAVGLFALVLFAFLAAVYLTLETEDPELQEDFRRRALVSAFVVGPVALLVFLLSGTGAPLIRQGLSQSWWTWPLQLSTAVFATGAIFALWTRRFHMARFCAAGQITLILWGWGVAQFPYLIVPDITVFNAAAPTITLRLLLVALGSGALVLFPSFYYLYRIFKG